MQQAQRNYHKTGTPPQNIKAKLFWAFVFIHLTYFTMILCALGCLAVTFIAFALFRGLADDHIFVFWPYILIAMLGVGGITGCYSIIRGLLAIFAKHKGYTSAYRITTSSETELIRFIMDICAKVGAKAPNTILILAEPQAFVSDEEIQVMNTKTQGRTLAIGLPILYVLSKNELRAILAHEFAHFVGEDLEASKKFNVAFGGMISAHTMLHNTIVGHDSFAARLPLYLPHTILGMCLYNIIKIRATIEQSQEFRADWTAAQQCGGKTFGNALIKIVGLSDFFYSEETMDATRVKALQNGTGYYHSLRESVKHLPGFTYNLDQDLDDNSSVFSSHPSLKARVDNTRHFPERYNDYDPALRLISNLSEYERVMDGLIDSYEKLMHI